MRAVVAALALLACSPKHRAKLVDPEAPVRVHIGDGVATVEIADEPKALKHGLMDRTSLPADGGMLFFMGLENEWSFWMHDTLVPLDIIWITKGMTVRGVVANTRPMDETPVGVRGKSLYVLEVNAGWAAKHGVRAGAPVVFENIEP